MERTNYKWHLMQYAGKDSRLRCPSCGQYHCFVPYVDDNGNMAGEEYGRCNHEAKCGYIKYPPSAPQKDWRDFEAPRTHRTEDEQRKIHTIPGDIVAKTIRPNKPSDLMTFLSSMIDKSILDDTFKEYNVGVTRERATIYWQIDAQGRCRSGKVMEYNPATGHRIKREDGDRITWIHSLMKSRGTLPADWQLTQCLFGEHLLSKYPDKVVAIVEAEKTAIVCAAIFPQYVWIATGGKSQFGDKMQVLQGRHLIAFPDIDGYDKWEQWSKDNPNYNVKISHYLQDVATEEDINNKIDIADLVLRSLANKPLQQIARNKARNEARAKQEKPTIADEYLSPILRELAARYPAELMDKRKLLADTFDLEVVSIRNESHIHN